MISRIDHVSIAVRDRQKAERFFRDILGAIAGAGVGDPQAGFFWQIFSLGDLSRLEIISPTGERSFLDGFLKDRQGGVHHITLQTPDLGWVMTHLEAQGIPFFGYNEYPGGVWREILVPFPRCLRRPDSDRGVYCRRLAFGGGRRPAPARWHVEDTAAGATLRFSHPRGRHGGPRSGSRRTHELGARSEPRP